MNIQYGIHRKLIAVSIFSKILFLGIVLVLSFLALGVDDLLSQVRVRGYYRKNGTYVRPHVRTRPDGNPYNNYSFPGNYNPNTGGITPGNPETYLRNYYKKSEVDSFENQVQVQGYYRKDGTYVRPHVRTRPDGNPYNNYSFPGNYNPNTGTITPGNPETYRRNYHKDRNNYSASSSTTEHTHSGLTSVSSKPDKSNIKSNAYTTHKEFNEKYDHALKIFEQSQYSEAIMLFSALLEENINAKLANNSQYWIGECYYGMGNYQHSITEFKKVFSFSDNDKYDDAYLKLGLCYLKIDDRQQAKLYFNQILDHYPESEYAEKAKYFLNKI